MRFSLSTTSLAQVPIEEAGAGVEAARRAATALGWTAQETAPTTLKIAEDPTRLHCHCQPLEATVSVTRDSAGQLVLEVLGRVPGRGPIARKHAEEATAGLARTVVRELGATDDGSESSGPPLGQPEKAIANSESEGEKA